jgi:hypothetical protein
MDLPRDLIELFVGFGDAGARYLLVGGHAVSAHGPSIDEGRRPVARARAR